MAPMPRTSFAAVDRRTAWVLLAVTLLATLALALASQGAAPAGDDNKDGSSDLDLYEAIADRMRDGEPYYEAAHTEMVDRGYGVQSVFNWRTPAYARLLALAPSDGIAQAVLAVLAAGAVLLTLSVLGHEAGRWGRLVGAVVVPLTLLGAFLPPTVLLAELTAGVLILLSVGLYATDRRWAGLAAGAAALVVRELAGIYVVVAIVMAVRRRRWREVTAWGLVLASYAVYFLWHRHQVLDTVDPGDRAYDEGWLQLGGPMFVLRTAQMDGVLLLLPLVVVAVLAPLMVLGLWSRRDEAGLLAAVTVSAYVVAFCFVGKPVNAYWGAVYTPLFAYGLVLAPLAVRDLVRAARGPARTPDPATSSSSSSGGPQ